MAHSTPPDGSGSSCPAGTESSSSPSDPGRPVLELPQDAATQRCSEGAGPSQPPRRRCIRFTKGQVETLIKAFKKDRYPEDPTVRKLAADLGIEVSRIKNWFQNRRSKYPVQAPQDHSGESQGRDHDQQRPEETDPAQPPRRRRITFTKYQLETLIAAFKKDRYPEDPTVCKLAADLGIEVSRIKDWFQNRRSRYPVQAPQDHSGESQGRDHDQQRPEETDPARPPRQRPIRFTKDQVEILIKAFEKDCYPDDPTVRKLAADLGTKDSRIKDWFRNRRSRYPVQAPQDHSGESQGRDHDQQRPEETGPARPPRRRCIRFTKDQVETLIKAFKKDRYPEDPTIRKLAADLGIEVSRIKNWFQNRRSKYPVQAPQDHSGESQGRDHDQQRPEETDPARSDRRSRAIYTEDQVETLLQVFKETQNPDPATTRKLAADLGVDVCRITNWFQNRRSRYPVQAPQDHSGESQGRDHDQQRPEETGPGGGGWRRSCLSVSQICALLQAYALDPRPGHQARLQLAGEVGIPEPTVRTWFENRRSSDSRFVAQSDDKPDDEPSERTRDPEPGA